MKIAEVVLYKFYLLERGKIDILLKNIPIKIRAPIFDYTYRNLMFPIRDRVRRPLQNEIKKRMSVERTSNNP